LLNSGEVQTKLSRSGGRADLLAKDDRPDSAKIDELFLNVLSRLPNDRERRAAHNYIAHADNPRTAFENILWALVNTKEFLFSH
jgi:hypothetical protein